MSSSRDQLAAAYEGLEAAFADDAARDAYRSTMLVRTREQADLVAPTLDRASVLEVGCGNGRLLIELARRGALREGLGVDMARSRIKFARQWADDEHLGSLQFEVADALELELEPESYDAVLCITGAFAYFEPLQAGAAMRLARRWAAALAPNGILVLELYPHPQLTRLLADSDGHLRLWRELEADDPWRFYLSDFRLSGRILEHDKTFIHRMTGEIDAGRSERLRLYAESEVRELLTAAGLNEIRCYEGWSERPYERGETMVVTARAR